MKWGFYSCMRSLDWGGSEELWSQAALRLLERGDQVAVNYRHLRKVPPRLSALETSGAQIHWRRRWVESAQRRWARRMPNRWLVREQPDFVTITQGLHTDDLAIAHACRRQGIPYAINVQCASESSWIDASRLDRMRDAFLSAAVVYFLSSANRDIVEANLCCRIERAQIVDNPFLAEWNSVAHWPGTDDGWRLACVGRLNFTSKGQDLILRALSFDKWRQRPLKVVFFGQDHGSLRQIESLATCHGLHEQVQVAGFSRDIAELWSQHHGLLLPSRYEGLPMVTVEAMLNHRLAIVTACGRNAELVDHDETGFLISAPTVELVDQALELAWERRHRWQEMGKLAAVRVRTRYGSDPVGEFIRLLEHGAGREVTRFAA